MSQDPRVLTLQTLSQFLVADGDPGDTLQRIVEIARDAIPGVAIAGISLLAEDGGPVTPVYTDEASPAIDEGQYAEGKGPCLDAWRQQRVVKLDDVAAASSTYPAFTRAALDHGVRSTLSLPLLARDAGLGALNLYARTTTGFGADDERVAAEIAAAATVVLADEEARRRSQQLGDAIAQRALIEQAKGVLMGRVADLTSEDAFALLVRASQRRQAPLHEVAQQVVHERGLAADHA